MVCQATLPGDPTSNPIGRERFLLCPCNRREGEVKERSEGECAVGPPATLPISQTTEKLLNRKVELSRVSLLHSIEKQANHIS